MEGILSIQSSVAYGHAGNSAAVFPLQRLGFEVWPVMTVLFSNHTGYGSWRGKAVEIDWVQDVIKGIEERGAFRSCRSVLSGYLGTPESGDVVLDAVERVRAANPAALYTCDPVMGDEGRGFFVRPGIPEFFKERAVPAADIVTPNKFELAYLAGRPIEDMAAAVEAASLIRASGPSTVIVTSLELPGREDSLGVLAHTAEASWLVETPRVPVEMNGTGDAFTALYLGSYLKTRDARASLEHASAAMYGLVLASHRAASKELRLIEAQDEMVAPKRRFVAMQVG